jgi:hypothetical protein
MRSFSSRKDMGFWQDNGKIEIRNQKFKEKKERFEGVGSVERWRLS